MNTIFAGGKKFWADCINLIKSAEECAELLKNLKH